MTDHSAKQSPPNPATSDEIKQLAQAQFAGSAQRFVESKLHREGADLQRMVELAALSGSERVLDVATGGGHAALAFAKHAREVVASDLTPRMLEVAAQFIAHSGQHNVQFQKADAEAMPFAAAEFDVVTARIAPHHFPNPARFVAEVARVLKPGGRFILDDNMAPEDDELDAFMNDFERWRDPSHVRALKLSQWQTLCEQSGLRVQHVDPLTTKVYQYAEWTERMRLPAQQTAALAEWLKAAPQKCRDFFDLQVIDGKVISLCATFGILVAQK
jgi:ubiquinone/menaquinone biosynthesis C-methylase UbiE